MADVTRSVLVMAWGVCCISLAASRRHDEVWVVSALRSAEDRRPDRTSNAVVTRQHRRRQKPTTSELVGTVGFVRLTGQQEEAP